MFPRFCLLSLTIFMILATALNAHPVSGAAAAHSPFVATWERFDLPVSEALAVRSWTWGPSEHSFQVSEQYAEAPGGMRHVLYMDKGRMEAPAAADGANGGAQVASGLLALELITGRMQVGDATFDQRAPAQLNVVGDSDDQQGITYASLEPILDAPPLPDGTLITWRLDRDGHASVDERLAEYRVSTATRVTVPGIDHQIAAPFWNFMNASGLVYDGNAFIDAALFAHPFEIVGFPVTEAYWTAAKVAGLERDVLLQCFERRCLTYTPSNPEGWQVEAGNTGSHYYSWRYGGDFRDGHESLSLQSVVQGSAPGGDRSDPSITLAAEASEFEDLAASLSPADRPALDSVDIDDSVVIAVLDRTRPTSGYLIEIRSIAVRLDVLEITVGLTAPPPGEPVRQGFETPYHVVAVDRDLSRFDGISRFRLIDEQGEPLAAGSLQQAHASSRAASDCDGSHAK